jgi:nucleoside 2-deoxyribosyltransferase
VVLEQNKLKLDAKEMKVYLAGPDVFLPFAADIGRRKIELCKHYGLTGLFPLDNEVDIQADNPSAQIFRGNEDMMNRADAIIANLTPFRGPSADVGTVYELGYMAGRDKLCLGYSNHAALYADRVRELTQVTSHDGHLTDATGLTVENFGLADNLMMVQLLALRGHPLVTPKQTPADIWHDLTAFEACVRMAAAEHSSAS